jgi:hypothetical protein
MTALQQRRQEQQQLERSPPSPDDQHHQQQLTVNQALVSCQTVPKTLRQLM